MIYWIHKRIWNVNPRITLLCKWDLTLIGMRQGGFTPLIIFGLHFVSCIFIKNFHFMMNTKVCGQFTHFDLTELETLQLWDVLDWHLWLLWSVKFLCGRLRPCVGLLPYSQMPSHQSFGMQMCIASGQGLAQFVHTAHIPTLAAVVCII